MTNSETHSIRKVARIHDKATDKYLEVVEFPISDSKKSTLQLQPSVVTCRLIGSSSLLICLCRYSFEPIIVHLAEKRMLRIHLPIDSGKVRQIYCPKMLVPVSSNCCR
jgi:hypothetical protein